MAQLGGPKLRFEPKGQLITTVHGDTGLFPTSDAQPTFTNLNPQEDDTKVVGDDTHRIEQGHFGTGTLTVDGDTVLYSTLEVTGDADLGAPGETHDMAGNVVITGSLDVTGATTYDEIAYLMSEDLLPDADNTYDIGNVGVRWSVLNANFVYGTDGFAENSLDVTNNASIGTSAATNTIEPDATFGGQVQVERDLTITPDGVVLPANTTVAVSGGISSGRSTTVGGNLVGGTTLAVAGDSNIGNAGADSHTFNGITNINGTLDITGTATGVDTEVTAGSWTPVVTNIYPPRLSGAVLTATGRYLAVENMVECWFNLHFANVSSQETESQFNFDVSLPFDRYEPLVDSAEDFAGAYFAGTVMLRSPQGIANESQKTDLIDNAAVAHTYLVALDGGTYQKAELTNLEVGKVRFTGYRLVHRWTAATTVGNRALNFVGHIMYEKA